jgi:hypothetical protein
MLIRCQETVSSIAFIHQDLGSSIHYPISFWHSSVLRFGYDEYGSTSFGTAEGEYVEPKHLAI